MAQGSATTEVDPRLVTRIVGSYVQHHEISVDELSGLIVEVRRTLAGLGRAAPSEEGRSPAVPVRRSVQQDYVICLDCGFRSKMLRRHISWARTRGVSRALEIVGGSSADGSELLGAALDIGKAARLRTLAAGESCRPATCTGAGHATRRSEAAGGARKQPSPMA